MEQQELEVCKPNNNFLIIDILCYYFFRRWIRISKINMYNFYIKNIFFSNTICTLFNLSPFAFINQISLEVPESLLFWFKNTLLKIIIYFYPLSNCRHIKTLKLNAN